MGRRCPAKVAAITHRCGSSAGSPGNREAPCHSLAGNNHLITWCRGGVRIQKKVGGEVCAHGPPGSFLCAHLSVCPRTSRKHQREPTGALGVVQMVVTSIRAPAGPSSALQTRARQEVGVQLVTQLSI